MKFNNQSGLSLVGIIVSVAVSVVVLLGVGDFVFLTQRGRNQVATSAEFQQLKTTTLLTILHPKLCTDIFANMDIYPPWQNFTTPVNAKDAVPSFRAISVNSKELVPGPNLTYLKEFQLRVEDVREGPALVDDKKIVFADIKMKSEPLKESLGASELNETIPVQFVIDEQNMNASTPAKIVACYSLTTACTTAPTLPDLPTAPPACSSSSIPTVQITIPASKPYIAPPGNVALKASTYDCVAQANSRMNVYVQSQGDASPRLLATAITPTSWTIINESDFDFVLPEAELMTPKNRIILEVACNNGSDVACDHMVIEK